MKNMRYCRTENVIAALREWYDEPGTDDSLHDTLVALCREVVLDFGNKDPSNG